MNSAAIILIETSESLNVGSVSRSMMNFGYTDLRLVAPVNFSPDRASITACGATRPLEAARLFTTAKDAIADRDLVVGLSAREGKARGQTCSLEELLQSNEYREARKMGLLFGPEDNGLRQEHIEQCASLVHIPTSPEYPSMNLAHACAVTLYALAAQPQNEPIRELVEWSEFDQLDILIRKVAEYSGFFNRGTPQPVPSVLMSLFRRLRLSKREMAILMGLFGSTTKVLEGRVPVGRKSDRPDE